MDFVDGTQRAICKLVEDQREMYSWYKQNHTFKFIAIMTPDGLSSHLCDPFRRQTWRLVCVESINTSTYNIRDVDAPSPLGGSSEIIYLHGNLTYIPAYGIIGGLRQALNIH